MSYPVTRRCRIDLGLISYWFVCRIKIFENLRSLTGAPSVQMAVPPPSHTLKELDEDNMDPDVRKEYDGKRLHEAEFYHDEKVRTTASSAFQC